MLFIEATLKETEREKEIQPYFKQCLKQICTLAPADSNVVGSVHELAHGFCVRIDVSSAAWEGMAETSEKNPFLAIDGAFNQLLEKIREFKDQRQF